MLRSRREVMLGLVASGTALCAAPARAAARAVLLGPGPSVTSLGIAPGMTFAGCTVVGVGRVELGAISMALLDDNARSFTVDVLRHDPETPGIARTPTLGAYLMNDGDGSLATDEGHGLAAMAIAHHITERETRGVVMPELSTLRERAKRRPQRAGP